MLSKEEVCHIAHLARIELSDQEVEKFGKEMSAILEYIEKLNELDTQEIAPIGHITGMVNIYREDRVHSAKEQEHELLIKNIPKKKNDCIVVKQVLA
ncbi:MAG: Asp-tRNA(Asn)/Glu-tRNA(Gln) amidotransferase subunit GatC [Candidatus Moraniibacteriota bacterium]|nr:MAG: Asp-tRNA(Asn)/Glu-tRNA(Gln) amidotransferase subunit GatC [Candidatus Moranbacteria bacterium]